MPNSIENKISTQKKQKIKKQPKVVYYDDEEDHLGHYQKPIRFADVFKYAS